MLVGAAARARVRVLRRTLGEGRLLVLGPGVSTGMVVRYDDPREVGPDRIANAIAARERYGTPASSSTLAPRRTSTSSPPAGEFAGGVLAPGDRDLDGCALRARGAAAEGAVRGSRARDLQTTVAALQSGLVYGFAGQVDAIVGRIRDELEAPGAPAIATGGLAELIARTRRRSPPSTPSLTLQGLRLVWERNVPG